MDDITARVQQQYQLYPFPMIPAGELVEVVPAPADFNLIHYYCTHRWPQSEAIAILDAGCGTGFSTLKLAQQNPRARILALDISQPSLAIAAERLAAAGLAGRAEFRQMDLNEAGQLKESFDYINCSGVLHHLSQPQRALAGLARCLRPEGFMHLMIYSAYARHYIQLTQELISRLAPGADWQEGLLLCRQVFQELHQDHPLQQDCRKRQQAVRASLGEAALAEDAFWVDTYLHACDHPLTLAEVFQLLGQNSLGLIRFVDEAAWDPARLLPGLAVRLQALEPEQRYLVMDPLRLDWNYSFFCGHQAHGPQRQPLAWTPAAVPCPSPAASVTGSGDRFLLNNGLGLTLELSPVAQWIWQQIDGHRRWEDLLRLCVQQFGFSYAATRQALQPFLVQLQDTYCVLVK